ncbi:ATP-binding protein [Stenotrophomonas sp. NPDC087984]
MGRGSPGSGRRWPGRSTGRWPRTNARAPPRPGPAAREATDDGATITVRDHGPGYPEDLLAEGPSRFRTGAAERGSHGLGLTIALGHTQVLGGTLTLANAPDGGANATLHLPGDTSQPG